MKLIRRVFTTLILALVLVIPILTFPNIATAATIGWNSGDATNPRESDRLDAMKFKYTGTEEGTLTTLKLLVDDSSPSGHVRMGVYSNIGGNPGALLKDAGEKPVDDGWVAIDGLNLVVMPDTYYWLVFTMDTMNGIEYHNFVAGDEQYSYFFVRQPYGPLPDPYPLPPEEEMEAKWIACDCYSPSQYCMQATIETGGPSPEEEIIVETRPAGRIHDTWALLTGGIIDMGSLSELKAYFEFDPIEQAFKPDESDDIGPMLKVEPGQFENMMLNLVPNTTYHYRAFIELDNGTRVYAPTEEQFTTGETMMNVKIELLSVTCNEPDDTEDEFYLKGYVECGDLRTTVSTSQYDIDSGETKDFNTSEEVIFNNVVPVDSIIVMHLEAYDSDWPDPDDRLGSGSFQNLADGPASEDKSWTFKKEGSSWIPDYIEGTWNYVVRYRITRTPNP